MFKTGLSIICEISVFLKKFSIMLMGKFSNKLIYMESMNTFCIVIITIMIMQNVKKP